MNTRLLIVGIDPGTTVAYSLLDLNGDILLVHSSKRLDLGNLIKEVVGYGKPLIVSSDVYPIPSFVFHFASQFNAKIISPPKSLLVKEKYELTKQYTVKNTHERDSLSAALFAFKEVSPLLTKIQKKIVEKNIQNHAFHVFEEVIMKGSNIEEATTPKKQTMKKIFPLKNPKNTIHFLHKENKKLRSQLDILSEQFRDLKKKKGHFLSFEYPENQIHTFLDAIKERDQDILSLKEKITHLEKILLEKDNYSIMKRVQDLSFTAFKQKGEDPSFENMLFVDDLGTVQTKTLELIKDKISMILTVKDYPKHLDKLMVIQKISSQSILFFDSFVVVPKKDLPKKPSSKKIFSDIIKEYKKAREM